MKNNPNVVTAENAVDHMNMGSRERQLLKLALSGAGGKLTNENTGEELKIWVGTQEQLDALTQEDGVLYFVTE